MRKIYLFALAAIFAATTFARVGAQESDKGKAVEKASLGAPAVDADFQQLKDWFHEAPSILPGAKVPLKGQPLWHTNGELTDEIIREIFEKGKENGFGGITFLPLTKTTPKYLSDEYLTQYGKALDLADQLGMKVVYYDDLDFPSGSAGWRLKEKFPEATIKRLDKVEWEVEGPAKFAEKSTIPLSDKALYGNPAGALQAAVAMNVKSKARVNIRDHVAEDGSVSWDVPEGKWKIMLFVCVADKKGVVDYMSPDAVKKFFSLTYDVFYGKFKEHFGTTITSIFFDDITNTQTEGSRNWALEFNDKFRELFGTDPDLFYPALFYAIGDETPTARYQLWTTRNKLFADGYPGMVKKWRVERNLDVIATGHPQGPYVIQPIDMCSDAMDVQKGSDAVLFDSIHYYGHGRDGFKLPTSAAFNYDFPLCYVEIYGNYREKSFDKNMMLRAAMEIYARGGNVMLPHGVWSDPATVYIPPEISWRNPKLEGFLPSYGEYVSRCSLLLQGGRHVADIAVLYPIDNLKAYWHFPYGFIDTDYPNGVLLPEETDYLWIGSLLTSRIWRDFTFIHPFVLNEKCSVVKREDGKTVLRLNNDSNWEEFETVVIPGADVISLVNLQKIVEFFDAGGRVIGTTRMPTLAAEGPVYNKEVQRLIQHIFNTDPRKQDNIQALATGQEDIVLRKSFEKAREINKEGEYTAGWDNRPLREHGFKQEGIKDRSRFMQWPLDDLQKTLDEWDALSIPDVEITPAPGTEMPLLLVTPRWDYEVDGMFQYIHKVKNGNDVYYFANSSNSPADYTATLRGEFNVLEFWNPITGETSPVAPDLITVDSEKKTTSIKMSLKPIESMFVVGVKK